MTDTPFDPSGAGFAASLAWVSGTTGTTLETADVLPLLSGTNTINSATVLVYDNGALRLSISPSSASSLTISSTDLTFDYSSWGPEAKAIVENLPLTGQAQPLLLLPDTPNQTSAVTASAIPEPRAATLMVALAAGLLVFHSRRRQRLKFRLL